MTYDDTPDFAADRRAAEEWAHGVLADGTALVLDFHMDDLFELTLMIR